MNMSEKKKKLEQILKGYNSAIVAFSGGVDSTLLAFMAAKMIDNVLMITLRSAFTPAREIREAEEIAAKYGFNHRVIELDILSNGAVVKNPPRRCYFCKKSIFKHLQSLKEELGCEALFEGSNLDDTGEYRPGSKAIVETGTCSPLKEAGLTKNDIREISRELGLPTHDKPAYACLASRFPYDTELTSEALERVERGEEVLFELGFSGHRLRDHFPIARLEIGEQDFDMMMKQDIRAKINESLIGLGYKFITLDLQGYRTGCYDDEFSESKS